MPNIGVHMGIAKEVAAEIYPEADLDFLLGSALPDFRGMALDYKRETINLDRLPKPLSEGIRYHRLTDTIFDGLEIALFLKGRLRRSLEHNVPGFEGPMARRTTAIAGDILLDGVLLTEPKVAVPFNEVGAAVLLDESIITGSGLDKATLEFIRAYFLRGTPLRYRDPTAVAQIAHSRLQKRAGRLNKPEVVFDVSLVPYVSEVLAEHIQSLEAYGSIAVTQATELLKVRLSEEP